VGVGADARSIRLIGYLGGGSGLSQSANTTLATLTGLGRRVTAVPVGPPRPAAAVPRPAVNLFHMNPMGMVMDERRWRWGHGPGDPNLLVPFWELPLMPRAWEPVLEAVDRVLAPSRYVGEACSRVIPRERIVAYPPAVFPPDGVRGDRAAWGLPAEGLVCVIAFDALSGADRKNPWAGIAAFQLAFSGDTTARLVVKCRARPGPTVERLRALAAADPRIRVVDRELDYPELCGLYASCDVMLALHRSEGLGLHLMEAMSLGKVVVATGYSGNMDFMNPDNSCPVPHRLVPVTSTEASFALEVGRPGQVWAEPDVAAAAAQLRALAGDASRRRELGARATATMAAARATHLAGAVWQGLDADLPPRAAARDDLRGAFRAARVRLRVEQLTHLSLRHVGRRALVKLRARVSRSS
jgi:glycosyltransferase involved in cell wall biosynthesis